MRILLLSDAHLEQAASESFDFLCCKPCLETFGRSLATLHRAPSICSGTCRVCGEAAELFYSFEVSGLRKDWRWKLPGPEDVDLVLLAGDISVGTTALTWALERWKGEIPVVYIAGNHEFYECMGGLKLYDRFRNPLFEQRDVHFLEKGTFYVGDLRVLGCTLWTNFCLWGTDTSDVENYMKAAEGAVNDFWVIEDRDGKRLTGRKMAEMFYESARWLDDELKKPWSGKTIVVTHFSPHPECGHPNFPNSPLAPYFQADMRPLMKRHQIELWCYGHTHWSMDIVDAESGTRIVSNQVGYTLESSGFDPEKLLEI